MKAILQFEHDKSVDVDEEYRKFSFIGEGETMRDAFQDGVRKYFEQHKFETDALGDYSVIPNNADELEDWVFKNDLGTIYKSISILK